MTNNNIRLSHITDFDGELRQGRFLFLKLFTHHLVMIYFLLIFDYINFY